MKILLIDNLDSFTHNLRQLLESVEDTVVDVRPNTVPVFQRAALEYDAIVISAGPGRPSEPSDLGTSLEAIAVTGLPTLGVCLGHQAIGHLFGATVEPTGTPMHGQVSRISHVGRDLFQGIDQSFSVVRYHSLDVRDLPEDLEALAHAEDDGTVMALRHKELPLWGVQFHPESILSEHGATLVRSFFRLAHESPRTITGESLKGGKNAKRLVTSLRHEVDLAKVYGELVPEGSPAVWLDSGEVASYAGRYSVLATTCRRTSEVISYDVASRRLCRTINGISHEVHVPDLLDYMEVSLSNLRSEITQELPFNIDFGWYGFFGFEFKSQTMSGLGGHVGDQPDAAFLFANRLVVVDHHEKVTYCLALVDPDDNSQARSWLDQTVSLMESMTLGTDDRHEERSSPWLSFNQYPEATPRHDSHSYLQKIVECQTAIYDGETYEICLTNKVTLPKLNNPRQTYQELRARSPVPFGALIELRGASVLCASPERFLSVDRLGNVESKPIKGTRPRSDNAVRDRALRNELASSAKDQAENLMIVDLVRHDLNAVCVSGTVTVPRIFEIESYSSVHQMVSTVRGRLRSDCSATDAIRSAFPGGSMTGAPKRRTLEIIDRLEEGPRGIYSGSIGWLGINGAADLNITIRTIVSTPEETTIGVGGAIVADSDPLEELEETHVKSRATVTSLYASLGSDPQ